MKTGWRDPDGSRTAKSRQCAIQPDLTVKLLTRQLLLLGFRKRASGDRNEGAEPTSYLRRVSASLSVVQLPSVPMASCLLEGTASPRANSQPILADQDGDVVVSAV